VAHRHAADAAAAGQHAGAGALRAARRWRYRTVPTLDEEIARHLQEALASGELKGCEYFGKPLPDDAEFEATPEAFRMPFKVLKNAGYRPPEIGLFRRRAELATRVAAAADEAERLRLLHELGALERALALRLEGMRLSGRL